MMQNDLTINYKETIVIMCEEKDCTDMKWFVTGARFTENSDGSITIDKPTGTFSVYCTSKDTNGKDIRSNTEVIHVKQGIKDKFSALLKNNYINLSMKKTQD